LIMIRISGYGQDGPYSNKPGFGSVGEAIGGIRNITGYPDRPRVRAGISLGDALASMYAVNSALMAIYHRVVVGSGVGQYVDVALYEVVFCLMESMVFEYDYKGLVRECSGSSLQDRVASKTYACGDGK